MKVSLNVIQRFVDVDLSVDELVQKINQQLGQIEEVTDLAPKYKDVVIVKVVKCEKHPDADRLSVCLIDDGGKVEGVERDQNGLVQVVCGAPNVRAGIFAAWLPPKSTVPASVGTAEPFVLDTRDLRGVKSNGMLAAADELGLGSDHTGIIEIDPDEWRPGNVAIVPGASFAEAFGLDDVIIDIENKMFTHRPDLFGQLGVAREIAGITGKRFESPKWYVDAPDFKKAGGLELKVFNEAGDKCPRFMAIALKDVTVAPSPLWLQIELVRLGGKPINNIVDATNYVMLLTAQPTHAYDYDKLRGATLGVRMARPNETAKLLNDKTYSLTEDDVVIVDGEGIVGLGGVMGGGNSEVSDETKNVVLECAAFDMYAVRKTSMRHGLFTDAVTRFSKGQSPLQQPVVLGLLMQSVIDTAGGEQASEVVDKGDYDGLETAQLQPINFDTSFINERLGLNLETSEIKTLLENVEFTVFTETDVIVLKPFWRTDVELPEDIVEEVGRLYGFDKLPRELPQRSITPAPENPVFVMKQNVRRALKAAGANEILTYSFVHERLIANAAQDSAQAFQLSNALSPDLQYYRLSVLPSLLVHVHANIKAGHDEFALFEFGKAHRKGDVDDEGLPREYPRLAAVYAAKKSDKTAYYTARRYIELIAPGLIYQPLSSFDAHEYPAFEQLAAPFEPGRSAVLMNGDKFVGIVGEFKASVRRAFKLPETAAGFELFQSYLLTVKRKPYVPLSRFPGVTQDITLKLAADAPVQKITEIAQGAVTASQPASSVSRLELIGIYQPEGAETKNITFRLSVTSYEKTLTDAEVAGLTDAIAAAANEAIAAERV
jgi:phenylalanyl-tRNA synthetase beta chain